MHPYPLDPVDRTLLNALQRDGRATVGDLAEAVSLSTSPCWRRVRALEEAVVNGAGAETGGGGVVDGAGHACLLMGRPQAGCGSDVAILGLIDGQNFAIFAQKSNHKGKICPNQSPCKPPCTTTSSTP